MKTMLNFMATGLFLATFGTGFGQPIITNQPRTQATAPGAAVTLAVGATGSQALTYQWQKNPGNGFSDLADRTNAALVLTNLQPWDACDYRVVITNITGTRTSAVARLYVMRPALVTTNTVIDNFDDNLLTDWQVFHTGSFFNTNQQLTVRGYYPGVHTIFHTDSMVYGGHYTTWVVPDGQTREWRVDLARLDDNATNTALLVVGSESGLYSIMKSRDFVLVLKWPTPGGGICILACERAATSNTNVVLTLALTRVQPNLVVTTRVLDKADLSNVLYQCAVVDTPNVDPTLNAAQFQALTGMAWQDIRPPELAGAPFTSFRAGFGVFQYTDGTMPAVLGTFDNFELWTALIPVTRYVDVNSTNPTPPYTNWLTAATNIQDAVDAALAGDEIVVTNGIYATGGRAVGTNLLVNRVAVDKPLMLRSVNGPEVTIIQGYQVPGTTNGDGAIRCVYLTNGASLSGFTLTNGATRHFNGGLEESEGGGVWSASTNAFVVDCVLSGNSAHHLGGGAFRGALSNCTLIFNSAYLGGGVSDATLQNCAITSNSVNGIWCSGGGAFLSTLDNCNLTGNAAEYGGGACRSILCNCLLTGNSAADFGGGASSGFGDPCTLYDCTIIGNSAGVGGGVFGSYLNNCIVYFNTATNGANYIENPGWAALNYCCTTPMPSEGIGNITNAPLFVDYAGGNLRLQTNSPCINAGNNAYASGQTDLDGKPRIVRGTVDLGAYEFQGPGSVISYAWLQQYSLSTDGSADGSDQDGDGHNTWQEWRCQTCPTNADSALRLLSAQRTGANVTITWQSLAGVRYVLERTTSLGTPAAFTLLAPGIPGQPGTTTFIDTNATALAPLFYRVGVP